MRPNYVLREVCVWLGAVACVSCGDSGKEPYIPHFGDAGSDATTFDAMSGGMDGSLDATASPMDGAVGDAASQDSAVATDSGEPGCTTSDRCLCPLPGALCTPGEENACPSGKTCISDGCGQFRCLAAGASCHNHLDCPSESSCLSTDDDDVCSGPGACVDSRDCPPGFACEAATCVDRRVPCVEPDDCPMGYICIEPDAQGKFCLKINRRCHHDKACPGGRCLDVDNDGLRECTLFARDQNGCDTNADCDAADGYTCVVHPQYEASECGRRGGPCSGPADCADGFECVDLWGDGLKECAEVGGSCTRSSQCPVGSVCASAVGSTTRPSCLTGNL